MCEKPGFPVGPDCDLRLRPETCDLPLEAPPEALETPRTPNLVPESKLSSRAKNEGRELEEEAGEAWRCNPTLQQRPRPVPLEARA